MNGTYTVEVYCRECSRTFDVAFLDETSVEPTDDLMVKLSVMVVGWLLKHDQQHKA